MFALANLKNKSASTFLEGAFNYSLYQGFNDAIPAKTCSNPGGFAQEGEDISVAGSRHYKDSIGLAADGLDEG